MILRIFFWKTKALDDILVSRDTCQIQPKKASPELQSANLVNCNFERKLCNWQIVKNGTQYEWQLYSNVGSSFFLAGPNYGANNSSDYLIADQYQTGIGKSIKILFKKISY